MIHHSHHPAITIPDANVAEFFLERISPWGERTALVDAPTGRSITFAELRRSILSFAGSLQRQGLARGDVLAIWAPNCVEYPTVFHGACLAGATVTLIGSLATDDDVSRQLRDSGAQWIVTTTALAGRAHACMREPDDSRIIRLDGPMGGFGYGDMVRESTPPVPISTDSQADVAALPYSSGTTGEAKGVMLTHANLVANLLQVQAGESIGPDDTALAVLPFFHIYGLTVVMNMTLARGTRLVVLARFEPESFLKALQDHGVTRLYVAPPLALFLAKHPLVTQFDLSRLRSIISGAAPLDAVLARECAMRTGAHVFQGYGLTETSPGVTRDSDDPAESRAGTIGRLSPSTEARIIDPESGRDAAAGEPGELWLRGPQVMKGYLGRPEATAAMLDEERWLHTGDLVRIDQNGYLSIVDRLKELIKYNGYQVAPSEIEAVLLSHPSVRDCALIAGKDASGGEIPKAYVVASTAVTPQELMDFVAARVAPYKKVRAVAFVDAIPKSPAGKILRRVLIDLDRAGA